jgi:membrane-associated protease RseP (regulator of RpoE activity)
MFGVPAETPYDLRFRLLGISVRVHPLFWLVIALLGGIGHEGFTPKDVVIFMACAFVSIVVHEYGHGLVARAFGYHPWIVLHTFGGLCISEAERRSGWHRLIELICGPGAGFLLAGVIYSVHSVLLSSGASISETGEQIYLDLMWINIGWGVLNLLPIYPLDGGQITGVVLSMFNPRQGMRWTHIISLVTAGVLAIVALQFLKSLYTTIVFAVLAVLNFQALQTLHHYAKYGNYEDDADWWKR